MSSDIRIELEAIRRRAFFQSHTHDDVLELIEEVERLHEVTQSWAKSWKTIVAANAEAHQERIEYLEKRVEMLENLL